MQREQIHYAVSWSQTQQCVHIELVRDMLAVNCRNWARRRRTDYITIALCDTREEADAVAKALQGTRDECGA